MARITCRTPSTGKPILAALANVPVTYTDIIEAPDFSVPDTSNKFTVRDPADATRAIRSGEVFCLTPLAAYNKDSVVRWLEVQLLTEDGVTVTFGRVEVPAGDTAYIPLQGRSIFKRNSAGTDGDRIRIRAEAVNSFDVWVSVEEKLANEHFGVE